jgi:hypothetical protein
MSKPTNIKSVKKECGLLPETWRAFRLGDKFYRKSSLDALDWLGATMSKSFGKFRLVRFAPPKRWMASQ